LLGLTSLLGTGGIYGKAGNRIDGIDAGTNQLESIARSQSLPVALSRRAQMILRLADGDTNSAVARRYRVSRPTVSLWRKRLT